jgi:hypothetical protein
MFREFASGKDLWPARAAEVTYLSIPTYPFPDEFCRHLNEFSVGDVDP